MKTFDVWLSYPIKVNAENEDHVKEIIMANLISFVWPIKIINLKNPLNVSDYLCRLMSMVG